MSERKDRASSTALIYHPIYLKHVNPFSHPERPERLSAAHRLLQEQGFFPKLKMISPLEASWHVICRIHDPQYVDAVRKMAEAGGGYIDADTYVSSSSFQAAKFAAGAVLSAIDGLFNAEISNAFCMVRPPGHHALRSCGMGFCLFNNLAIGAQYALDKYQVSRILIVDWDAHHGNGINDIFFESPQVLYFSLHQSPLFPGTGSLDEIGQGEGEGYTVNVPLPAGAGDEIFLEAFQRLVAPLIQQFSPELIMVAAGYDGHFADPLASLKLTTSGYAQMTKNILSLAAPLQAKVVISLEGGYDLRALSYSILATVNELVGTREEIADPFDAPKGVLPAADGRKIIDLVVQHLSSYWEV